MSVFRASLRKPRDKHGFTIVELLIVITVIAILAAISIGVYVGIQERAHSAAVRADLGNAKKKIGIYQVDYGSPDTTLELVAAGVHVSPKVYDTTANNFYYCVNKADGRFALGGRTPSKLSSYTIASDTGLQQLSSVSMDKTCQAVGLTGNTDPNAYSSSGYNIGSGVWQPWTHAN